MKKKLLSENLDNPTRLYKAFFIQIPNPSLKSLKLVIAKYLIRSNYPNKLGTFIQLSNFYPKSTHLVGTGTSVRSPITAALLSRRNAASVLSRKSTSPTRMLLASAPAGILRIKCVLVLCSPFCSSPELVFRAIDTLLGLCIRFSPGSGRGLEGNVSIWGL